MNILIAGASGFIGHELIQALKRNNPNISFSVLGRNKLKLEKEFGSNIECISWNELPHNDAKKYDAVINLTGPFNLTSPFPISQKTFAEALAKTIKRPLFLKMPARLINLLFGEMGECLLLRGQRVYPKRLKDEGFTFLYPTIDKALAHEFC